MGGHNVLQVGGGKVAVRNDHIQLTTDGGSDMAATVGDVEYQGTYVLLGLRLDGQDTEERTISVMLPEASFVQQPYRSGDRVGMSWNPAQAHPLAN